MGCQVYIIINIVTGTNYNSYSVTGSLAPQWFIAFQLCKFVDHVTLLEVDTKQVVFEERCYYERGTLVGKMKLKYMVFSFFQ